MLYRNLRRSRNSNLYYSIIVGGLIFSAFISCTGVAQTTGRRDRANSFDTTIVGKVIDTDSIFFSGNASRVGQKYYYGLFHVKVGVLDVETDKVTDTLIITFVYNKIYDINMYADRFRLKNDSAYIFDLSYFTPCNSDFPRLEGVCSGGRFIPLSNKLIKSYTGIYRVINKIPLKRPG